MPTDEIGISKFKRFEHWLTNTFWYHYKWYWLLGVFAAAFAIMLIIDNIRSVDIDWNIAYVVDEEAPGVNPEADTAFAGEISEYFSTLLPDRSGDDRVTVNVYVLYSISSKSGQMPYYRALNDGETYLIAASEDMLTKMNSLGYLVYLGGDSYWKSVDIGGTQTLFAVNDGFVELTNREQAAAIGMTDYQIDDFDSQLIQQHEDKMQIALEALKLIE